MNQLKRVNDDAEAALDLPPVAMAGMKAPGFEFYPGAPLEYYSDKMMQLICELFADVHAGDYAMTPEKLGDFISGMAAGLTFSDPVYSQCAWKAAAIDDLNTLESLLVMLGRSDKNTRS